MPANCSTLSQYNKMSLIFLALIKGRGGQNWEKNCWLTHICFIVLYISQQNISIVPSLGTVPLAAGEVIFGCRRCPSDICQLGGFTSQ